MSFDALTLSAVRDELEPLLVDGRLQRLVFLDELSLAVEYFNPGVGRGYVLFSTHPELGRVQRLERLPARGLEPDTPFSLVARKHLRNARVRSLRQPRLERVLELDCEQRDASGEHYKVLLIVEAMGRRSNLVLVDQDGLILDAVRRSPPSRNPRRPVLPHLPYVSPPPQDRLLPEQLSAENLATDAREQTGTLASYLGQRVAGLSPQAARELAFRATGALDTPTADAEWPSVLRAIHAFMAPIDSHQWQPTLAIRDERPAAYAPYQLHHLAAAGAQLQDVPSISAAMEAYYAHLEAEPIRRGDLLAGERSGLIVQLDRSLSTLNRRIGALEQQLLNGQNQRDPLRRAGELILTHQAELPLGSSAYEDITLDPTLTASENAQAYFARYRKAREAEERVPGMLEEARQQAAHLAELRTLVEVAPDMNAIRALRREVRGGDDGKPRKRGQPAPKSAPHRRVGVGEGWEALIGSSAAGNAAVTFDLGAADDLWLHARGVPGAHVILRGRNAGEPPEAVVERAAELAAWHSAARASGRVEVDVAPRRHVRKIPNAPPGLVRYSHERTLSVTPRGY